MDVWHNADALGSVLELAKRCNKYIDETAPWVLAKSEESRPRLEAVLYNLLECIRMLGVMLLPFLPRSAEKILAQLGISGDLASYDALVFGEAEEFTVGAPEPLFARIDADKILAELAAEKEAAAKAAEASAKAGNAAGIVSLPQIGIEDFARVELRVARVTACEPVKKAKKLLKLTLDDGSGTPRTVCSGIARWYKPEDLTGKQVVLVANLKPAVLCGVEEPGDDPRLLQHRRRRERERPGPVRPPTPRPATRCGNRHPRPPAGRTRRGAVSSHFQRSAPHARDF